MGAMGIQDRARLCEGTQCKGYRTKSKASWKPVLHGKANGEVVNGDTAFTGNGKKI